MFLKQALLFFIGLSAGGVIAAGIFAFITVIGTLSRIIGKSHQSKRARSYETLIILGGTVGNFLDIYLWPLNLPYVLGIIIIIIFGLASGIFVGCLIMSLAETLDALPILCRRIKLTVGAQYIILSMALGKATGALLYFIKSFAS